MDKTKQEITVKDLYENRYEADKLVILIERMYKQKQPEGNELFKVLMSRLEHWKLLDYLLKRR